MRLLPFGETALLVECDSSGQVEPLRLALAEAGLPLAELVPGARTVLVGVAEPGLLEATRRRVSALLRRPLRPAPPTRGRLVEVPVVYDGPDLAEVAELTGLPAAEVVAAHTGSLWRVAFGGFAPGFAYLAGGDPRLAVPRLTSPRTAVPAGSVALADGYSGVYPRASPGGWRLIGSTAAVLWDPERDPPALLGPGVRVRFVAGER